MTKSYHLTQEQVREIRDDLINTSIINSNTSALEDFTNLTNAALDKVLVEPVAWAEAGRENNVIANLVKQTNKNEWVKSYSVALYAPKEKS